MTLTPIRGDLEPELEALLRQAGAVMGKRDGRTVPVHYGSVAAEVAVCVKRAAIAVRGDLDALELLAPAPRLERLLAHALGEGVPEEGRVAAGPQSWCCRVTADRALVLASPSAAERWRRIAHADVVSGGPLVVLDPASLDAAVALVGPAAHELLRNAGLPADLAVDAVQACRLADIASVLLRQSSDGFVLLVARHRAADACRELFEWGRPLGISFSGLAALDQLAAARRRL